MEKAVGTPELNEMQLATLREMASYSSVYWFRQATCKSLVALGLAEAIGSRKRPPHRITQAGREALRHNTGTKARFFLDTAGIEIGRDFNSLTSSHLDALLKEAETTHQAKYGKPLPIDRITKYVRERYDLLQRRAGRS